MKINKYYPTVSFLVIFLISAFQISAQNEVTVSDVGWGEVDIAGFKLIDSLVVEEG